MASLQDLLPVVELTRTGALIGVEHEFRVRDASGELVDFRALVDGLAIDGRQLDPGDIHAWRIPSGAAITADGAEAEVASPPLDADEGANGEVLAHLDHVRGMLLAALPPGFALDGYSTHISISVADDREDEFALHFARTFALPYAWLAESPNSLGIYVRPRPGRLELCSDFVDGARLEACIALAVGALRALQRGAGPFELDVALLLGVERHGYRLHRTAAFGFDSYTGPRTTSFPAAADGTILGQEILELAWNAISRFAPASQHVLLDAVIQGTRSLGVEETWCDTPRAFRPPSPTPDGELLRPRNRNGLTLTAAFTTWWSTVLVVRAAGQSRYVSVPRTHLAAFLYAFDHGELDDALRDELAAEPGGCRLSTFADANTLAAWDEVDPAALSPVEWPPSASNKQVARGRPGKVEPTRPGKWLAMPVDPVLQAEPPVIAAPPVLVPLPVFPPVTPESSELPPLPPTPIRPWVPAVILVAIAAGAVALGAFVANSGGEPEASPTATSVAVIATETASPTAASTLIPPATLASTSVSTPVTTPLPTATSTFIAPVTATTILGAASTPTVAAAATPTGTSTPTPSPTIIATPTRPPTETPAPTPRPTSTIATADTLPVN